MESPRLSIRAASWAAAQCVRHFCRVRGISSSEVNLFCRRLEVSCIAASIIDWDESFKVMAISGLGDLLPPPLDSVEGLNELVCAAREVTASQMYAAWTPHDVVGYLREAAERSGLDPAELISGATLLHLPDQHGWGAPVTESDRNGWLLPNNLFNSDALKRAG